MMQPLKTAHKYRTWGFLLLAFAACNHKPATTVDKIENLKKQVENDAKAWQDLEEKDYPNLSSSFRFCDSILQYMDSTQWNKHFQQLNLTNAYLQQFANLKGEMHQKMAYSLTQLDHLKADTQSQYISDSIALVYLDTETKVADTLHSRVLYFQDRFANCQKELTRIKKDRR